MDKIEKALQKLSAKERQNIKSILQKLHDANIAGMDIKKLKNRPDIFRIRAGDLRIIYRNIAKGKIVVLSIARRNEKTYKL